MRYMLLLLLPLLVISASAAEDIPLKNGSFDAGLDAKGTPEGWSRYGGALAEQKLSLVPAPQGKALLIDDGSPTDELGITQTVPIKAGETYRVTVMVAAVSGANPAGAYLQMRFQPTDKFTQVALTPKGADGFTEIAATMTAPEGSERLMIYLYSHKETTPKVLVDNVKVQTAEPAAASATIPEPKVPQYAKLKDLHLATPLVQGGKPMVTIVAPPPYMQVGESLKSAIKDSTGVEVPVVSDDAPAAALPLQGHLIVLGNRSTNKTISALYDRAYTFLDLKYPGPGGYVLRSLHSPFGDGRNVIFVGGSDDAGVATAARALVKKLSGKPGDLTVGWLSYIKL
ncbi:MAG: carbohydrate binding domain-containing protein, partial [Armatimonadia bacterium]